jgi:transaldolase
VGAGSRGKMAIAVCKLIHNEQISLFSGRRFLMLAAKGARIQRLLWAGTGIMDVRESDLKYVDELIGPGTVITMPLATLEAYRDHGDPQPRLAQGLREARGLLDDLAGSGTDLAFTERLLEEQGVKKFQQPFDELIAALAQAQSRLAVRR